VPPEHFDWTELGKLKNHPLYVVCSKTSTGYRGQIVKDGQKRWVREASTPHEVARQLRVICPELDHVLTASGVIENTGCLTLAECIECAAEEPVQEAGSELPEEDEEDL
jgi:hypothetical protein